MMHPTLIIDHRYNLIFFVGLIVCHLQASCGLSLELALPIATCHNSVAKGLMMN